MAEPMLDHPQPHTFVGKRGETVINPGERAADAPTLRYRDVYDAVLVGYNRARGMEDQEDPYYGDNHDIDPVALAQNVCVRLEELAGIFPNINKEK